MSSVFYVTPQPDVLTSRPQHGNIHYSIWTGSDECGLKTYNKTTDLIYNAVFFLRECIAT